jgi:predicted nucleic acid-binding protein
LNDLNDINIKSGVVLDTGILIEYLTGSILGQEIDTLIVSNPEVESIIITDLTITELYYINCRLRSTSDSKILLNDMIKAFTISDTKDLRMIAGDIKCDRKISLADCYSIAAAEFHQIPVIFKYERELEREIKKRKFSINLIMVD